MTLQAFSSGRGRRAREETRYLSTDTFSETPLAGAGAGGNRPRGRIEQSKVDPTFFSGAGAGGHIRWWRNPISISDFSGAHAIGTVKPFTQVKGLDLAGAHVVGTSCTCNFAVVGVYARAGWSNVEMFRHCSRGVYAGGARVAQKLSTVFSGRGRARGSS